MNPNKLGFDAEESSANLFYNYADVRDTLMERAVAERRPFFWFFENTCYMGVEDKKVMKK